MKNTRKKTAAACEVFLACFLAGIAAAGDEISSPADLVGAGLTAALAEALPQGDCSTPESTWLGYLRSKINGTLFDALSYETGQAREETLDGRTEADITAAESSRVAKTPEEMGFASVSVQSLSWTPAVAPTQFIAVIRTSWDGWSGAEQWTVGLVQTNGVWKVDRDEARVLE